MLIDTHVEFERLARAILELSGRKKDVICCGWIAVPGREYEDCVVRIAEAEVKGDLYFEVELTLLELNKKKNMYHNPVLNMKNGASFRFHGDHIRGLRRLYDILESTVRGELTENRKEFEVALTKNAPYLLE